MYHSSLIDTDIYKMSMGNFVLKKHPRVQAQYTFINRGKTQFPEGFSRNLKEIVDVFQNIRLHPDEKNFMREKVYYLDDAYLDFLEGYRYDPSEVMIKQVDGDLYIKVVGPMYRTIYWEVPLMATISELYFKSTNQPHRSEQDIRSNAAEKAKALFDMRTLFSEFGTRRRYSYNAHCWVLDELKKHAGNMLVGTSNPHLAMVYNLMPMGTIAHELVQLYGAMFGYQMANRMVMEAWTDVYQGDLGTMLPDTFTTKVFLRSFNSKFAKLFDGVRHDSGDPLTFFQMIVEHYEKLRIDPTTKSIIFSDSLDSIEKIRTIHEACAGKIRDRYGIGTWLTNDCGPKPLNMVIKLSACKFDGQDWVNTVKLSDNVGKNTGDTYTVDLCKKTLCII